MNLSNFGLLVFVVIFFAIGGLWITLQWKECRDAGFSKFYCFQHVS